jgi:lysophospholipid acyltransferase (LPLAT)-like uncharacterized protein
MKLRSPWLIRPLAFLGACLIRCWMGTLRYRLFFADGVKHPTDPRHGRYLYAFWHESILVPTVVTTHIRVLISQHADGELIAQVCRFLGFGVVRGSTTRGGSAALLDLYRQSRDAHLAVTPDGPRGPRRRVQPGLIYLASVTGLPIVVAGVGFSRAWRARSWDRFAVPLPWSTVTSVVPPAIHVPPRINRSQLEHYLRLVEEQFLSVTAAAERWAQGGPRPAADPAWDTLRSSKASA